MLQFLHVHVARCALSLTSAAQAVYFAVMLQNLLLFSLVAALLFVHCGCATIHLYYATRNRFALSLSIKWWYSHLDPVHNSGPIKALLKLCSLVHTDFSNTISHRPPARVLYWWVPLLPASISICPWMKQTD